MIFSLLSSVIPIPNIRGNPAPETVYVDDDYSSSTPGWQIDHFDKIQDGIDTIDESGTVYVYNGIYYENVVIDKTIKLTGENRDNTIIDVGGSGDVIRIEADWVIITGFTIQNSGSYLSSGIFIINSFHNTISGNIIKNNNDVGIKLHLTSCYNVIVGNTIKNNTGAGILQIYSSSQNTISGNNITNNTNDGVRILINSNKNTISGNNIINNTLNGLYIAESSENDILGNTIANNNLDAIQLKDSSDNNVSGNLVVNNGDGIFVWLNSNNNNFFNNWLQNAYDESTNIWDNGYPSGGNYWDDYTGNDGDGDGIGDTPYDIPGGSNQDRYPLMQPWFMRNAPTADAGDDVTAYVGESVSFEGTGTDIDGTIELYEWDFDGNGAYDWSSATTGSATHTYYIAGTYIATLRVTDNDGLKDTDKRTITTESGTEDERFTPLGRGIQHKYDGIPFEIYGVNISVYHKGSYSSSHIATYDLSGRADEIHMIVAAAYAENVPNGVTVGQINAYYVDGSKDTLNLISGINIAEWAYDRPGNPEHLQHTKIEPAYSFYTNIDSPYYYYGHYFYVNLNVDGSKSLDRLGLVLEQNSYTGQNNYGGSPADWYKISIQAITLELSDGKPGEPVPDMAVVDFTYSPTSPKEGDKVYITPTFRNEGDERETYIARFYVDGEHQASVEKQLSSGHTITYNNLFYWYAESGEHELKVSIDPLSGETDVDDNYKTKNINVGEGEVISAKIVGLALLGHEYQDGKKCYYKRGNTVSTKVWVMNTGNVDHRFWVGFTIRNHEDNSYIKDIDPEYIELSPKNKNFVTLEWPIPGDAPYGDYDATIAVWKSYSGGSMHGELDRWGWNNNCLEIGNQLYGYVRDYYGHPLEGTQVKARWNTYSSEPTETNRFGLYEFNGLPTGEVLTVEVRLTDRYEKYIRILDAQNDDKLISKHIYTSELSEGEWKKLPDIEFDSGHEDEGANVFRAIYNAVKFYTTNLGVTLDHDIPENVYIDGNANDKYGLPSAWHERPAENKCAIRIHPDFYDQSASYDEDPDVAREEFSHHVMLDLYEYWPVNHHEGCSCWPTYDHEDCPNENHEGYNNPCTCDSLCEGWAEFMSCVIADFYEDEEPYIFRSWDIEVNHKDSEFDGTYEEFAIAGILWDLYDDHIEYESSSERDRVTLSIDDIWSVLGTKKIDTCEELYDEFKNSNLVDQTKLDEIFNLHSMPKGRRV